MPTIASYLERVRGWGRSAQRVRGHIRLRPFDVSSPEGRSSERYRRILLTTLTALATRAVTSVVGLVSVPLTLSYLGSVEYGFWSLLSTAVSWFSLIGLNIGRGLSNAIAEAHGKADKEAALSAFSTATLTFSLIAIIGLVVLFGSSPWVDWSRILLGHSPELSPKLIQVSVLTTLTLFLLSLPATVPSTVLGALQQQYWMNIVTLVLSVVNLPLLLIAIHYRVSIPVLLVVFGATNILSAGVSYFHLTRRAEPWLRLSMRSCTWASFRRLVQTSLPTTLFQIAALLVNESQQLILARKANLSTVANYAILMRIALLVSTFISLGTTAFLPAFREAEERGDQAWLKRAFRRMVGARVAIAAAAGCAMVLLGNLLVRVWLHRSDIHFEISIWLLLAVGLCAATWVNAFTDYMSALDDIWRQVVLGFISGAVSIGLSLWLTPQHGILGALVATYFVAIVFCSWILPLMVKDRQTVPATSVEHV